MNRRVERKVYEYSSGWGSPTEHTRYVYHGWNVILELDALDSNAILRKYTWGLDIAGLNGSVNSIEQAAGIGGLLACLDTAGTASTSDDRTFVYSYDANGNVTQLVETSTSSGYSSNYGTLAGAYDYDAYGNTVVASGGYSDDNLIRFSTRPVDPLTLLGHWPMRVNDFKHGRWGTRDPAWETGGAHLYAALRNQPITWIDPDGGQSMSFPGVRPIGGDGPGDWPPGVPFPRIPVRPIQPAQPHPQDVLELWCYEPPGFGGLYHCDVRCSPASGAPIIGGGTGPASSGGYYDPGGNPGWHYKSGIQPGAISGGSTFAPAGTCDCIKRKAAKMNQILSKEYQFPNPCRPTTSNSNALLSTVLRCCDVAMKPTRMVWFTRHGRSAAVYSEIVSPGWGDDVLYRCGRTSTHTAIATPEGVPVSWDVPCLCPVTCDLLN